MKKKKDYVKSYIKYTILISKTITKNENNTSRKW